MSDMEDKVEVLALLPHILTILRFLDRLDPYNHWQAIVDVKNFFGFYVYVAYRE